MAGALAKQNFFISDECPNRPAVIKAVKANGGVVVARISRSTKIIAPKGTPLDPGSEGYTLTWLEKVMKSKKWSVSTSLSFCSEPKDPKSNDRLHEEGAEEIEGEEERDESEEETGATKKRGRNRKLAHKQPTKRQTKRSQKDEEEEESEEGEKSEEESQTVVFEPDSEQDESAANPATQDADRSVSGDSRESESSEEKESVKPKKSTKPAPPPKETPKATKRKGVSPSVSKTPEAGRFPSTNAQTPTPKAPSQAQSEKAQQTKTPNKQTPNKQLPTKQTPARAAGEQLPQPKTPSAKTSSQTPAKTTPSKPNLKEVLISMQTPDKRATPKTPIQTEVRGTPTRGNTPLVTKTRSPNPIQLSTPTTTTQTLPAHQTPNRDVPLRETHPRQAQTPHQETPRTEGTPAPNSEMNRGSPARSAPHSKQTTPIQAVARSTPSSTKTPHNYPLLAVPAEQMQTESESHKRPRDEEEITPCKRIKYADPRERMEHVARCLETLKEETGVGWSVVMHSLLIYSGHLEKARAYLSANGGMTATIL